MNKILNKTGLFALVRVSDPVWYWPDPDPTSRDKPDPDTCLENFSSFLWWFLIRNCCLFYLLMVIILSLLLINDISALFCSGIRGLKPDLDSDPEKFENRIRLGWWIQIFRLTICPFSSHHLILVAPNFQQFYSRCKSLRWAALIGNILGC